MEYTVIGDNVNIASRIEGLTKDFGCHIIISESTYQAIKDVAIVNSLGSTVVRGREAEVVLYELKDIRS